MLAKRTRSDDTPDDNSDDLLGFHFTRTSSGRLMRRAYRRPSLYACKTHSFGRHSRRQFGRPSRVPLHTFLVRTNIMRRAYRRPSLYACKTNSFGRHSRRPFGRPSRVPLHTYLVRTTYETSVQTTVSVCLQN
jgi:hypothetical protein